MKKTWMDQRRNRARVRATQVHVAVDFARSMTRDSMLTRGGLSSRTAHHCFDSVPFHNIQAATSLRFVLA